MPDPVSRLQLARDEIARPYVLDLRSSIPRCNTMKQTANASVGTLAQLAFIG